MNAKELREIEEMAWICPTLISDYTIDQRPIQLNIPQRMDIAFSYHNAGYRKIPDGAVVISKEEYDDLKRRPSTREWVDTCRGRIEQARKETAKEILSKLLSVVQDKRNKLTITTRDPSIGGQCKAYADMETTIREIALEMGVEVEQWTRKS